MAADPITPAVSERICKHMNNDHADAVLAFSRYYGGLTAPITAQMLRIETEKMVLAVDGSEIAISFDHPLTDSEDAHRTLVAMLRAVP
jgi:putative heme iron utilization protein